MQQVVGVLRNAVAVLAGLGVLSYGAAAAVTVADILGRQVGYPIDGVVDLVQLFVMAGAWLVMPWAFMAAAHVSVDFVLNLLPPKGRRPLIAFASATAFVLVGLMLWHGWNTYETRTMFGDRSQQLGIPIAWYWYPLLLGLAVSLLGIVLGLIEALSRKAHHE